MRLFLSVAGVLFGSFLLNAQSDSLATDTLSSENASAFRLRLRNEGGPVNGVNICISSKSGYSPMPPEYRVNGLDLSIGGGQRMVNGVTLALLYQDVDTTNGICLGLVAAETNMVNGLYVSAFFALEHGTMNGLAVAGFSHVGGGGNGLSLSGLTNIYDKDFSGVLLSGVYNRTHEKFSGLAIAGATQLFWNAKGMAVSGAFTLAGENFSGFLFSGISSCVLDEFHGVCISAAVNRVGGESHGLLVAAVNSTPVMQGVQLGLINQTNRLQGVQIGLINVNKANPKGLRVLPLVNFNFRPLHETDTIRKNGDSVYVLKSYFHDGKPASISQYKNGKLNGVFILYNQFGDKVRETKYVNGLKEGEELFFNGKGKITESSNYHADTLTWSASFDYPEYTIPGLVEKTIYSGGKAFTLGLLDNDTIYFFAAHSGCKADYKTYEDCILFTVYKGDSLVEMTWAVRGMQAQKDTLIRIRPDATPPEGWTIYLEANEPEYMSWSPGLEVEGMLYYAVGHAVPLTVICISGKWVEEKLIIRAADVPVDSSRKVHYRSFYGPHEFHVFYPSGEEKLYRDDTVTKVFYPSGELRHYYHPDSSRVYSGRYSLLLHLRCREDFYPDGTRAYYENNDSACAWDKNGKLLLAMCRDTIRTFYPNEKMEYEVSPGKLNYYDEHGRLRITGTADTMYTFHADGSPDEKLVYADDNYLTVIKLNGPDSHVVYYGWASRYFKRHERRIYRVLRDQPQENVSGEETPALLGLDFLWRYEDGMEVDELSPVPLPSWAEYYGVY